MLLVHRARGIAVANLGLDGANGNTSEAVTMAIDIETRQPEERSMTGMPNTLDSPGRAGYRETILIKAMIYTHYGLPDVLLLKDVEKPTPKDNEVVLPLNMVDKSSSSLRSTSRPVSG